MNTAARVWRLAGNVPIQAASSKTETTSRPDQGKCRDSMNVRGVHRVRPRGEIEKDQRRVQECDDRGEPKAYADSKENSGYQGGGVTSVTTAPGRRWVAIGCSRIAEAERPDSGHWTVRAWAFHLRLSVVAVARMVPRLADDDDANGVLCALTSSSRMNSKFPLRVFPGRATTITSSTKGRN